VTTIKATCPACGEVDLTPVDVRLTVASVTVLSSYAFTCPRCHTEVRKPADDHVVSLLISGGVEATMWEIPAEALEVHAGPALGYDDLLDFALGLAAHDLLADRATTSLAGSAGG
jgi:hypothetical protein